MGRAGTVGCLIAALLMLGSTSSAQVSGTWKTVVEFDFQSSTPLSVSFRATPRFDFGQFAMEAKVGFGSAGWDTFSLSSELTIGSWSLSSICEFAPSTASFDSLKCSAQGPGLELDWNLSFSLGATPDQTYFEVLVSDTLGEASISIDTKFKTCELIYESTSIEISGLSFCCSTDLTLTIDFDCNGFSGCTVDSGALALPNLPFLTTQFSIEYTLSAKSISLSFDVELPKDESCFSVGFDVVTAGIGGIAGLSVETLQLACDSGDKTLLFLHTPAWEMIEISVSGPACCSGTLDWMLRTYFATPTAALFNWKSSEIGVTVPISTTLSMGLEATFEVNNATALELSFEGTW